MKRYTLPEPDAFGNYWLEGRQGGAAVLPFRGDQHPLAGKYYALRPIGNDGGLVLDGRGRMRAFGASKEALAHLNALLRGEP